MEPNLSKEEQLMVYAVMTKLMWQYHNEHSQLDFEKLIEPVLSNFDYTGENFYDTWNEFEIEMVAYMHHELKWTVEQMVHSTDERHRQTLQNIVDVFRE